MPASTPEIFVKEKVILGKRFTIHCKSSGTLPITYTLLQDGQPRESHTVNKPEEEALFLTTIQEKKDINGFQCRAQNQGTRKYQDSQPLNASLVGEVQKAHHLFIRFLLICHSAFTLCSCDWT